MTEPPANADRARAEAAASGALRVGIFEGSPLSQVTDRISGEKRGLGYDLGAEFARRLNVPLAYVAFQRNGFSRNFLHCGSAWSPNADVISS